MPPAVNMSDLVRAVLLPGAMWGMLSALLLELIELRGLFIEGGAARLRLSTLAFALGVVLIQRLEAEQGKSAAGKYGLALGASMLLFTIVETLTWNLPVSTFFVNVFLLGVLWWAGHNLTAACAVEEGAASAAAERGIFSRDRTVAVPKAAKDEKKKKAPSTRDMSESEARISLFEHATQDPDAPEPETCGSTQDVQNIYRDFQQGQKARKQERRAQREVAKMEKEQVAGGEAAWSSRLGGRHPGRVLLWFALFAIPVFGAAGLFGGGAISPTRSGVFLFVYLWCALTLLWLASLGQLRAYFRQRDATLPEVVAMSWIGLGLLTASVAVLTAFMLPSPASASNAFVRGRIVGEYRGWQTKWGLRDTGPDGAPSDRRTQSRSAEQNNGQGDGAKRSGGEQSGGGAGEKGRSETSQPAPSRAAQQDPVFDGALQKFFKGFLVFLAVALLIIAAIVLYVCVVHALRALAGGLQRRQLLRTPRVKKPGAAEKSKPEGSRSFASFADPFRGVGAATDMQSLIRELWAATVAFCIERGAAPEQGATPREFMETQPDPLAGFEQEARWLADLFAFSEFSGQPVPDAVKPKLEDYWKGLKIRAA